MKILKKEIHPGKKRIKNFYVSVMLWFVGRALQAVSKIDPEVRKEITDLPENCLIGMSVYPFGEPGQKAPAMFVRKTGVDRFRFEGRKAPADKPDFLITFKNIDTAMLVLTFREKTTEAQAYARFTADGPLAIACTFVRILNRTEIYLLPKPIALCAVRRYDSPKHKHSNRIRLYVRTVLGF